MSEQIETSAESTSQIESLEQLHEKAANLGNSNVENVSNDAPAYTPNYKYVAGGQEREFPEYLRSVIKDAETEKQLREVMSKADGLPLVKQKAESLEKQLKDYLPDVQTYRKLKGSLEKGDIGALVAKGLISDETLMKFALQRAQYYKQYTPEQRQAHDQAMKLKIENEQLQEKLAMQQEYASQTTLSTFENDLNTKYGDWVKAYPKFKDTVLLIAQNHYSTKGFDLHHEDYIKMAQEYYNGQLPQATAPQGPQKTVGQQRRELPTVPHVKSSGQSPIGKKIESLEDLRKLRDQKFGNNS